LFAVNDAAFVIWFPWHFGQAKISMYINFA
jgi:hypothetical protein